MTSTTADPGSLTISAQPAGTFVTPAVANAARTLAAQDALPAYVYDLGHLREHLDTIHAAFAPLAGRVELLHAVKANPDPQLLGVISQYVHGLEVASSGELKHVREHLPEAPVAFGGPGKTNAELAQALSAGVSRFHAESRHELHRLSATARATGRVAKVLLRVNIPTSSDNSSAALTMGGVPSPFGMDPAEADAAAAELADLPGVQVVGVHAHLASGLDAPASAELAGTIVSWALAFSQRHKLELQEVNVGGGMAVDYATPAETFDWADYARRLGDITEGTQVTLRIEPGRAVSAYSGWYISQVLDLKPSHGEWFAVCSGGTHHLRTPAAKQHNQPLAVLPVADWNQPWQRPHIEDEKITFVGQLCTPKDVLARQVPISQIAVGDFVIFAMAGAYAHNISHTNFLMHPAPAVMHVESTMDAEVQ